MNKYVERLYNGVIKENPTFVLMLGMCPTLAVTSSAINGLGMGLSTLVVLVFSNLLISLFRKVIPNGVRMPAYIVIVASLVTVVQFLMQAYLPSLSKALGVYIPLIVVNCIILGRAESYHPRMDQSNLFLMAAFNRKVLRDRCVVTWNWLSKIQFMPLHHQERSFGYIGKGRSYLSRWQTYRWRS